MKYVLVALPALFAPRATDSEGWISFDRASGPAGALRTCRDHRRSRAGAQGGGNRASYGRKDSSARAVRLDGCQLWQRVSGSSTQTVEGWGRTRRADSRWQRQGVTWNTEFAAASFILRISSLSRATFELFDFII